MTFVINSIKDLDKISKKSKWQYFEKLTSFILEENGFESKQNVLIKENGKKRQFDVVAKDCKRTLLVECKKWNSRREKSAALKSAVTKHLERCSFYSLLKPEENIFPIFVTLMNEDIAMHQGVPIIPIMKLNAFLQEELINLS